MDALAADVLVEALGLAPFHFAGLTFVVLPVLTLRPSAPS
jgi:hypothetical protein